MNRAGAGMQSAVLTCWKQDGFAKNGNFSAPLRTAAYIRVSTDSDDQENSYEAQERYFSSVLQGNPMIENAGIYFDRGITGTDLSRRTGFRRLIRHCEEGKIDRIICKSISRFARNTKDFVEALQHLKKLGVTVYFETPGFDTADNSADFALATLAAIAEEESRSISQNILDGLEHHYKMGETRNCDIYGYRYTSERSITKAGYRYRDVEVVEAEAEVVRRIFHSVENGMTFVGIARELNGEGIPAPGRGHKSSAHRHALSTKEFDDGWTGAMISRLVRNERYCGDVLIRKAYTKDHLTHKSERNHGEKERYRIENHHAPIVSHELFEKVQDIIECNKRGTGGGNKQPRTFSGLLVCGECGRNFHARRAARDVIWFCPTAECRNGKCLCHTQKRREGEIRQVVQAAVETRRVQDSGERSLEKMSMEPSLPKTCIFPCMTDAVGKMQFIFNVFVLMRSMLEEDDYERRYAEVKQSQAGSSIIGKSVQGQLEAIETARAEAEAFREYREKAVTWVQRLPGGDARWNCFLKGVSGEHAKAFFTQIMAGPDGGYVFRWFDGVETRVRKSIFKKVQ